MGRTSIVVFGAVLLLTPTISWAQPLKLVRLYQGRNRGPEQSDTFTRKIHVARDGRVTISNVSGDIVVTATSGDELSIDATKRWRGAKDLGDQVTIVVDDHPARVEIRTDYGSFRRGVDVAVDYKLSVPAGVALDVHSVSGQVHVAGVKGSVRLGTVSGSITTGDSPAVEYARTVSGDVDLSGVSQNGVLSLSTVSGGIRIDGVRTRELALNTVSGDIVLRNASCDRVTSKSVSGSFEYVGSLVGNGRYEVTSHSGGIRFALGSTPGFEVSAESFSGSLRSEFQMSNAVGSNSTSRGRRYGPGRESLQSTYGDGSASLQLRTFSGSIVVAKR